MPKPMLLAREPGGKKDMAMQPTVKPDGAQRDQSQLDFLAADDGGNDASDHGTAAEPCHQNGGGHAESGVAYGMLLGNLQGDQHQRPGQEPEVGDADFTEPQVTLAPQVFELDEVFVKEFPFKFPRLLGRIPGQEQGGYRYGDGNEGEDHGGEGRRLPPSWKIPAGCRTTRRCRSGRPAWRG